MTIENKIKNFYIFNDCDGIYPIEQLKELNDGKDIVEGDESSGRIYLFLSREHHFKLVEVKEMNIAPEAQITKGSRCAGRCDIKTHSITDLKWEDLGYEDKITQKNLEETHPDKDGIETRKWMEFYKIIV